MGRFLDLVRFCAYAPWGVHRTPMHSHGGASYVRRGEPDDVHLAACCCPLIERLALLRYPPTGNYSEWMRIVYRDQNVTSALLPACLARKKSGKTKRQWCSFLDFARKKGSKIKRQRGSFLDFASPPAATEGPHGAYRNGRLVRDYSSTGLGTKSN